MSGRRREARPPRRPGRTVRPPARLQEGVDPDLSTSSSSSDDGESDGGGANAATAAAAAAAKQSKKRAAAGHQYVYRYLTTKDITKDLEGETVRVFLCVGRGGGV
jgi:hypothetical protein